MTEQFGDPLAIWRNWCDRVSGGALAGGHFLMEESSQELTARLKPFLKEAFREPLEPWPTGGGSAALTTNDGRETHRN